MRLVSAWETGRLELAERVEVVRRGREVASSFQVMPVSGSLGVKVTGLDLNQHIDDAVVAELRQLLLTRLALFFPGQFLSHGAQQAFAERFGDPEHASRFSLAPTTLRVQLVSGVVPLPLASASRDMPRRIPEPFWSAARGILSEAS